MLSLLVGAVLATAPVVHPVLAKLDEVEAPLEALYQDLHRSPELSLQEEKTAGKLSERLRTLGFEVTTGVGGHGVVGVLRNGKGPTVLLRTDMDALPVREETGLPWASTVTANDTSGTTVPVMHACGHDAHMTSWIGAATLLSRAKSRWRGTLVLVGQPAEEVVRGAKAMIADGLLTRFPRPDHALALHVTPLLPAGQVVVRDGPILAAQNGVEIVVHGRGGHGALPHLTVDPVLIASRVVVALQGIVARENNPLDPAVITVGTIHGGTKSNVIPDDVTLQLTVRSYDDKVQARLLEAIERVAKGEAQASNAPRAPTVKPLGNAVKPTINDATVAGRVRAALKRSLGDGAVAELPPVMASEDFSEFGYAGIPSVMIWIGAARDAVAAKAGQRGEAPGLHTSRFTPEVTPTLRTGMAAFTAAALELLAKP